MILLNRLHDPVTVLGPGTRVGIWLQGCSIGCAGCMSRDTWDFDPERAVEIGEILNWCREKIALGRDGVTISGGEPFDQPEPLAELMAGLREILDGAGREADLLVYSGRKLDRLERDHADLLALADAVIAGPFMQRRPTDRPWMGSDNQELVPITELGRRRYSDLPAGTGRGRMQLQVDEDGVRLIGVPDVGSLARVEQALAERGVTLGGHLG